MPAAGQLPEQQRRRWRHVGGAPPALWQHAAPLSEVRQRLAALLQGRILVGHHLRKDLAALALSHPAEATRDTLQYRCAPALLAAVPCVANALLSAAWLAERTCHPERLPVPGTACMTRTPNRAAKVTACRADGALARVAPSSAAQTNRCLPLLDPRPHPTPPHPTHRAESCRAGGALAASWTTCLPSG